MSTLVLLNFLYVNEKLIMTERHALLRPMAASSAARQSYIFHKQAKERGVRYAGTEAKLSLLLPTLH
jgi:hypothetical protein